MMMYKIVVTGHMLEINWMHHAVAWGLPTLVTFLPLINVTYGAPDGMGWCWVVALPSSPSWALTFWEWANYYAILWPCVGIIFVIVLRVIYELQTAVHERTKSSVTKVLHRLQYYPWVIIASWIIPCYTDFNTSSTAYPGFKVISYLSQIMPCLQGFLTAVAFWSTNSDVRQHWLQYISSGNADQYELSRSTLPSASSPSPASASASDCSTSRSDPQSAAQRDAVPMMTMTMPMTMMSKATRAVLPLPAEYAVSASAPQSVQSTRAETFEKLEDME